MHPETHEGEVFLTNVLQPTRQVSGIGGWTEIGWKSKRQGMTTYSESGRILPYMRPVFVSLEEVGPWISANLIEEDQRQLYPKKR